MNRSLTRTADMPSEWPSDASFESPATDAEGALSSAPSTKLKADEVARRIREAILDHRLAPGTKLTEAQLCDVFDVKRGVVRQALAQLAAVALVEIAPNRGAFVASPSERDVREVFEMRRIVERSVVEYVCASAQAMRGMRNSGSNSASGSDSAETKAFDDVAETITQERSAYRNRDFGNWVRLSGEFHLGLARMTGNNVLCDCMSGLVARSTLISALYESLGHSGCSFDEHDAILAAIKNGDSTAAGTLMAQHLRDVEIKMMERPQRGTTDLQAVFGNKAAQKTEV